VGGDWYDCLVLDDDRVALVVGDVMGKGLHAAAQMGQIRMAVRSVAGLDPSPAAVLTALDDLNIELGTDEIVTMTYVLVDPVRGVARVARAGHLPPLLVHPYGAVQSIEEGGSAPLGASFGQRRVESSFTLPIGSLLVLYTDGLVEDRATGLDRGMPELTMALAAMAPYRQPMGDLAARLLEECTVDRGRDDIALLVARYG
jgi:serine phosphatase RsbU (regulator of sigma subunit)